MLFLKRPLKILTQQSKSGLYEKDSKASLACVSNLPEFLECFLIFC